MLCEFCDFGRVCMDLTQSIVCLYDRSDTIRVFVHGVRDDPPNQAHMGVAILPLHGGRWIAVLTHMYIYIYIDTYMDREREIGRTREIDRYANQDSDSDVDARLAWT